MRRWIVGISALALIAGVAIAADNFPIDTFAGTRTVLRSTDAAGVHTPQVIVQSGTMTLPTGASTAANQTSTQGTVAPGTAATASTLTGCVFNSTAPAPTNGQGLANQCDTTGSQYVSVEGRKTTYRASGTTTLAAAATDVCIINGSASKTVRVTAVRLSGIATTALRTSVVLVKRSTADTGGTSATITAAPVDSTSAAATAVATSYSANPTPGTGVVNIAYTYMFFPLATAVGEVLLTEFGTRNTQTVPLRGTAQGLAANIGGVTVSGGIIDCEFEWYEE